jgi:hypothetical protein
LALTEPGATCETGERLNLLGLTLPGLEAYVRELGDKPFRARQLSHWIYKRGEGRIERMTDLAKRFRALLAERAEVRVPEVVHVQRSGDGTRKWLLRADARQAFEMVFIPEEDRGTLCIAGWLCARLLVLLDRTAGVQPQPHNGRDRRSGVARKPRAHRSRCGSAAR